MLYCCFLLLCGWCGFLEVVADFGFTFDTRLLSFLHLLVFIVQEALLRSYDAPTQEVMVMSNLFSAGYGVQIPRMTLSFLRFTFCVFRFFVFVTFSVMLSGVAVHRPVSIS